MNIGNFNNSTSFKGIAIFESENKNGKKTLVVQNTNDNEIENLSRKHDVVDSFCSPKYTCAPRKKELAFVEEACAKIGIPLNLLGNIKAFYNKLDSFQVVGDKALLTVTSDFRDANKELREKLNFPPEV